MSSIRTTVLFSRPDTMAVVEDVVRVPGRLDPQEPGVARPPVSLGKVYGLTAGCVPVLELRELLHPGVEAELLLQFPHCPGTPGVRAVSEQTSPMETLIAVKFLNLR